MTQASNTFNSLILPRKEISPEAENVHHITMSMLQESKTSVFQSVARTFLEWLDVWRTRFSIITKDEAHENKVVMLVAHNGNRFDFLLLRRQLCDAKIDCPSWLHVADSLPSFRYLSPYPEGSVKFNLKALSDRFVYANCDKQNKKQQQSASVVATEQEHRAMADVHMLMSVAKCHTNPETLMYELFKASKPLATNQKAILS